MANAPGSSTFTPSTPEFLTFSRFYFEVNNNTKLLIAKASGISITIETTDQTSPIGSTKGSSKGAITQTQATPTGVSTQNVTLEFITTADNNVLYEWYVTSHPKPRDGGARKQMENRVACSLVFLPQDGDEKTGARWNIMDAIPANYKTTPLAADANGLFKETVEIAHSGLVRVNIANSQGTVAGRRI